MSDKIEVELKINSQEINLNPFVQEFFANALLGALKSLHDIPENVQQIELSIKKS